MDRKGVLVGVMLLGAFVAGLVARLPAAAAEPAASGAAPAYAMVVGYKGYLAKRVTISIDYGQEGPGFFQDPRLRDEETGKVAKFESMVDAMNYMDANGWEFVDAYAVAEGNTNVYNYLFKRKP